MPRLKTILRSTSGRITLVVLLGFAVWGWVLLSNSYHDFKYSGVCETPVSVTEAEKLADQRFREFRYGVERNDPNLGPGKDICTQIPLTAEDANASMILLYRFDCSYDPTVGERAHNKRVGQIYAVGYCGRAYFDYGYHE